MISTPGDAPFPGSVAITGGAGFLGRHLIALFRARHPTAKVHVADVRGDRPPDLDAAVAYHGGVDIRNVDSLTTAFQGVAAVVHLAGLVSFWRADRDRLYAVNRDGTRNVLVACSRAGVKRLVHVSSAAAIGFTNDPDHPVDETLDFDWKRVAKKDYMCSKHAGELVLADADRLGVSAVVANPASMYGPGDVTNTHRLFQAVQRGVITVVPPGGNAVVDVRDAADGLYRLLCCSARNERFILVGHNLTFRKVNAIIAGMLGVPVARRVIPFALRAPIRAAVRLAEYIPGRPAMIAADDLEAGFLFRYYSSAKAERQLGWPPRRPFEQTVRDAADFLVTRGLLQPFSTDGR